jgi:hypothetical protein
MAIKYKNIPWYEWLYQASECWKIFSYRKWRELKQSTCNYSQVTLTWNKTKTVHSLVALTFLWERPKWYDINHKDWNKLNNKVSNLEYCTRKYNIIYNFTNLWHKSKRKINILQLDLHLNLISKWESSTNASLFLWISRRAIVNNLKWLTKTSWGFIWKYNI